MVFLCSYIILNDVALHIIQYNWSCCNVSIGNRSTYFRYAQNFTICHQKNH